MYRRVDYTKKVRNTQYFLCLCLEYIYIYIYILQSMHAHGYKIHTSNFCIPPTKENSKQKSKSVHILEGAFFYQIQIQQMPGCVNTPDWGRTDVIHTQTGKHLNDVTNHSLQIPPEKVNSILKMGILIYEIYKIGSQLLLRFLNRRATYIFL